MENETELVRPVVRVGNSAGIILPKKWLNNRAKVVLIPEKIGDISHNIIKILDENNLLKSVLGIYLSGSYARGEQRWDSDIDILVISSNINKQIKIDDYDILIIPEKELKEALEKQILPILPMLKESKVILNEELIKEYTSTSLTRKNLKWHIETTKSALEINKKDIEISREMGIKNIGDANVYSLILRLREAYIVDSLIKNKPWSNKKLISLIKKICSSELIYKRYLEVKKDKKEIKYVVPMEDGIKLIEYIGKKIREQEKWLKGRKD